MKRLKIFILLFCLSLSFPLGYVIWRTYEGLAQEEQAQLRFFAETLFDQMQQELVLLVQREENRSVEEYHHKLAASNGGQPEEEIRLSPLAQPPPEDYIVGYLQNNPDGSFLTPLVEDVNRAPVAQRDMIERLSRLNRVFNQKKSIIAESRPAAQALPERVIERKKEPVGFAERYIQKSKRETEKEYLGQKAPRVQELTPRQAMNLAQDAESAWPAASSAAPGSDDMAYSADFGQTAGSMDESAPFQRFQVEVTPLQSVFIEQGLVFIFRRVAMNNQIYRQGFLLNVKPFVRGLTERHFSNQPLARFTGLRWRIMDRGRLSELIQAGADLPAPDILVARTFPAPFDFLSAALSAGKLPDSPARGTLDAALIVLGIIMLAGLLAIYHSARTVVDLSERRSRFVSSVTHELKTPLTNIRMYIEMLEQGIAVTPEREQDYLRILGSESARLARLINNVLELAKLEKKQRSFRLEDGRLDEVFAEVDTVMAHKLEQENFSLQVESGQVPVFAYDREVLMQVLINLIENSIKFGKNQAERIIRVTATTRDGWVDIAVSDTGPGIPKAALKKVFDDFYRADTELVRTTGGTGLGLALVKKFMDAMDGRVRVENNAGPGCTVILSLPVRLQKK